MTLDARLEAVYQAVRPGSVAADIGADHGKLICALVERGKCPRGFAGDVAAGPLEASRRLIRKRGLDGRIETVLSDGLRSLPGKEIDDIILAGMGGELITDILLAVPWTRDGDKRLILQPMTRAEHLRRALYREGFALLEETAAVSGRFVYTVMTAAYTGEAREIDERFAQTGLLWKKNDDASARYLQAVWSRLDKRVIGLERAGPFQGAFPLRELCGEIMERLKRND